MNLLKKKFPVILGFLVLVGGIAAGIFIVERRKRSIDIASLEPQKVRVTNVSDSKFTVSWLTNEAVAGYIRYGKVGEKIETRVLDDRGKLSSDANSYKTHHVTVEKLQPDTQYGFLIISGKKEVKFDNDGSSYTARTGSVLTGTPTADAVYGEVVKASQVPAEGAIVYLEIPGAVPLSTLVKSSGKWTVPISVARARDLSSWIDYDPKATVFALTVEAASGTATAQVTTLNANPVPKIVLGESYDFRKEVVAEEIDEEVEQATGSGEIAQKEAETPGIFNVEPLGSTGNSSEFSIINPSEDGEILATTLPEFRGTGKAGVVLSVVIETESGYADTLTVEEDGTWAWVPPGELSEGEQIIKASYIDSEGLEQEISRNFVIQLGGGDPAFEASGSASSSPSAKSATPSARVSVPSTESGVPTSGLLGPTVTTGVMGLVVVLVGVMLLVI